MISESSDKFIAHRRKNGDEQPLLSHLTEVGEIAKYSIGTGDCFGLQGKAQLAAVKKAQEKGVEQAIIWSLTLERPSPASPGNWPWSVRQKVQQ